MYLNPDSVREVMLVLEDHLVLNKKLNSTQIIDCITNEYGNDLGTKEEIKYAILLLHKNNMIHAREFNAIIDHPLLLIDEITPEGHEFISMIRNEEIWTKTKISLPKTIESIGAIIQTVATIIGIKAA